MARHTAETGYAVALKLFSAVSGNVRDQLLALLADWTAKRADQQFTFLEFMDFSRKAIQAAMEIVNGLGDNATKKALVLEFAGLLFDFFGPVIVGRWSWIGWLVVLFGGADKVKEQYLLAVSLLIEALLARMVVK